MHQVPRRFLYIPDNTNFDPEDLTDERFTITVGAAAPFVDNWRQEGEGQEWEQA